MAFKTPDQVSNLPMKDEASNIGDEAQRDAGFEKMLKFKKGIYYCDGEEIALGTKLIAHCVGWTKTWVHFVDQKVIERKIYRVARGEKAPERDQLPDNDQSKWPIGINRLPADPWVYQYLLPLEDPHTEEVRIFVGSSFGGRRAVADLCAAYSRRAVKNKSSGQPIITLQTLMMPTKNYGDVPRPHFEIVGWDDMNERVDVAEGIQPREPIREVSEAVLKKQEFEDDIPF
jgi:hypothetical protein